MTKEAAKEWITKIHADVGNVFTSNQIFWQYRDVVNQNEKLENSTNVFLHWINGNFADSIAIAVRRQTDKDQRAISLQKLLMGLKKQPKAASSRLTEQEVEADLNKFRSCAIVIQNYADKRVAHSDRGGLNGPHPRFQDLTAFIDCMVELVNKYSRLIPGVSLSPLPPTEPHAWKNIFRFAWMENESEEER